MFALKLPIRLRTSDEYWLNCPVNADETGKGDHQFEDNLKLFFRDFLGDGDARKKACDCPGNTVCDGHQSGRGEEPRKGLGDARDDGYGKKERPQRSASGFLVPADHEGINDHGRAAEADGCVRKTGPEAREQAGWQGFPMPTGRDVQVLPEHIDEQQAAETRLQPCPRNEFEHPYSGQYSGKAAKQHRPY